MYTVSVFRAEAPQATASEGHAQGPYMAARVGFEPATLRTKGDESTNAPPHPTIIGYINVLINDDEIFYFRYYVGIALSCLLMMLVLFTSIGLCFGLCGEAPGDGARTCNRGVGASFLMA